MKTLYLIFVAAFVLISSPVFAEDTNTTTIINQCDLLPDSLGCSGLDAPPTEELDVQEFEFENINPVSIGGGGSCPSDITTSFAGRSLTVNLSYLCTYAQSLRPLILLICWVSAAYIYIGGVKNG